jgi:hypothetical protein
MTIKHTLTAVVLLTVTWVGCAGAQDLAHTGVWRHTVQDLGQAVLELHADGSFVFAEEDRSESIPGTYTLENGIATFTARSTVVYRVTVQGDHLMFSRLGQQKQHADDVVLGTWYRYTSAPIVPRALAGKGNYSVHGEMLTFVDELGGVSQFAMEKQADGILLKPMGPDVIAPEKPAPPPGLTVTNMLDGVEARQAALYEELVRAEMRQQLYVDIEGQRYSLPDAYQKVLEMAPSSSMGRAAQRRLEKLKLAVDASDAAGARQSIELPQAE